MYYINDLRYIMGIPKFFKFISERWPLISQLIDENQIPEFDNLYLDMNSILHTCTHPNDGQISRMTDDQMYASIFNYIEHLFEIIKPKGVFYMAIDGVAPRAKMNQQRARRFRTAIEAEEMLKKAIESGEEIPKEDPFDSNSITPGTEFMSKLTSNLKYFIHKKISQDSNWSNIQIILSGHEVPGEGEHKIMDYIRTARSQPDYDPNKRHCIYGLDADLIMLGLVSHDPHFALLREEVTFGPQRSKKSDDLNDQRFYLLHLSLLREYMSLEFEDLVDQLSFEYSFDNILDDFILIMYVIGNDFLPNLPDLFINKGAFPLLIATFKQYLKQSDGYINQGGKINLKRLSTWLHYLSEFELENFEKNDVDVEWFNKKLDDISISGEKKRKRIGRLMILKEEKKLIGFMKAWLIENSSKSVLELVDLESQGKLSNLLLPTEDAEKYLEFLKQFCLEVNLILIHSKSKGTYEAKLDIDGLSPHETEEEHQERFNEVRKIIKKYQSANLFETEEILKSSKDIYDTKFLDWKDKYYKEKLKFSINDREELVALTTHYIEGLQWVLYYYYAGCKSWNWYYKYHYAPRISDISTGLDELIKLGGDITFDLSKPFKPFEQLMAVLPARSRKLMPAEFRPLMTDPKSPIIDFYPMEVDIDQNGKTASWEAVVLLDFVDENRLIKALTPIEENLALEIKQRNTLGESISFIKNPQIDYIYPSPLPGFFQDLEHDTCFEKTFSLPKVDEYKIGLIEGANVGKELLAGFPSLSTIAFQSELQQNEVKVFNYPSKSESMILTIENIWNDISVHQFSDQFVNKLVYSKWPFLRESKVVKVMDNDNKYESVKTPNGRRVVASPLDNDDYKSFRQTVNALSSSYNKTKGVNLGKIDVLVYVQPVNGLIRNARGAYVKTYSKDIEAYPLQLIVKEVTNKDQRYAARPPLPIEQEFPQDSEVIFLGDMGYGAPAKVVGYTENKLSIKISKIQSVGEPIIGKQRLTIESREIKYYPSYDVSKQLKINPLLLSKITSGLMIDDDGRRVNIGLELKFEGKRQKVMGYTKKINNGKVWGFSSLAINLINEYKKKFPKIFVALAKTDAKEIPKLSAVSTKEEIKEVRKWLGGLRSELVPVSLESESFTKFSFQAIEQFMEKYVQEPIPLINKDIKGVPRDAVLNPEESYQLLSDQKFELGDRIVYIQDFGKVPVLSKGTVVGISTIGSKTSLSVIFDHPLLSGNTFNGKLLTRRGLTIDSSLVINLSNKQFVYHSNASKGRKKLTDEDRAAYQKAAETKRSAEQSKKVAREKEFAAKKSNDILSLLKRDQTSAPEVATEESDDNRLQNSQAIKQIYGQIYSDVMNDGQQPHPVAYPPPPVGYGIPVVPGIPLPPQFFQGPPPGSFAPPQQFQDEEFNENRRGRGGSRGRGGRGGPRGRGRGRGRGKPSSTD